MKLNYLLLLIPLFFTSCSDLTEEDSPIEGTWSVSSYPLKKELMLARVSAKLLPQKSHRFYSPGDGKLLLREKARLKSVDKNEIWAVFSPDLLRVERELLDKKEEALKLKCELLETLEEPRTELALQRELKQLEENLNLLELSEGDSYDLNFIRDLLPGFHSEDSSVAIEQMEKEISLLKKQIYLSNNKSKERIDYEAMQLEFEKSQLAYASRLDSWEMKMPFDGELFINLEEHSCDDRGAYIVRTRQLLGIARQTAKLEARVPMQDSLWRNLNNASLFYQLILSSGEKIRADYKRMNVLESRGADILYYYFLIDDSDSAKRHADSYVQGALWMELDEPARIIPKFDLLRFYPDAFEQGNWSSGIQELWPHSQLLAEGHTLLAISFESDSISSEK